MPGVKPGGPGKFRQNFGPERGLTPPMKHIAAFVLTAGLALAWAQHQHEHSDSTAPTPAAQNAQQELAQTTEVMAKHEHGDHEHHMGPHMKMSALRAAQPDDQKRADAIVNSARAAIEKYKDSSAAEADGFRMFLPNVKHQKQYHFTNFRYAMEAAFGFNSEHPTSLLYQDGPDGKLKLIGLMYTAPARLSEQDLDQRIPLSVAQWHQHVNLCMPPKEKREEMFGPAPKFGLLGSISTEQECTAAGGTFKPRIFGWMVHLYPYEKTSDEIWSVERQRPENMAATEHHH